MIKGSIKFYQRTLNVGNTSKKTSDHSKWSLVFYNAITNSSNEDPVSRPNFFRSRYLAFL